MSDDLAERVEDVLAVDAAEFEAQAKADAEVLKRELREGTFDNHQSIVGLEYEFYAVSDGRWSASEDDVHALMRVPRRLLGLMGFEKELGLHNAEMTTSPQPLNPHGLRAQESEVRARLDAALDCAAAEGMRLVSDGMWSIPPAGESAREYLTDSVTDGGVRLATNMSNSVRYHAMANGPTAPASFTLDAPHVSLKADTVMPEALITSIQPHYQVPHADDLPYHFNYALRVAGPLLALGVNSPFFPADLYDEDATADEILDDGWDENRIAVFESVLNSGDHEKVAFPGDLDTVEDAVDRVVEDSTMVPMSVERGDRFDDDFATLRRKHGTYWRWVRPVFDGASRSSANARIEFRPIAGQPTVRDSVAFQAAFAGLMERLPRLDHPVIGLDWETAEENFYTAMREGPHGDLRWIDVDGDDVTGAALYEDLLVHARDGLRLAGCSEEEANYYLEPLRKRVETGVTPADWKRARVRDALNGGGDFGAALREMQREYVERQSESLLEGAFSDWF
ncbi:MULTISPECIES: hypothetical protein [unclassified Haloferax]|uniref:hypothetical protein n=1 Tax=Haloferax TaxID=2251 RepID=UPI0002AF551B|nr:MULTISPECIES: hypothetical protein [unclassified Haloferax]ELZ60816.1 hypothetical protein C460_03369 [Haloferax sp. ATCC BAA-646]ELZ65061.1 hypothetical protein C459_06370 [Haloferax sp. ATCC BAA-645]ELZ70030.1 hypothetical protein C458_07119 [Haloferax sp. ATCC BAA-644]